MQAAGQSAVLREFFARTYAEVRPRRLAILGCTTGEDFACIDPAITELTVGVDLNAGFLDLARARFAGGGGSLQLLCGDVLEMDLPPGPFDLIQAALRLAGRAGTILPSGKVLTRSLFARAAGQDRGIQ